MGKCIKAILCGGAPGAYCVVVSIHATLLAPGCKMCNQCQLSSRITRQRRYRIYIPDPPHGTGCLGSSRNMCLCYLTYPTAGVNALTPITSIMIKVQPSLVSRVAGITAINNIINQIILNDKNCEVHNNFTGFTPIAPHCKHPFYLKYLHHLPCQA